MTDAQFDSKIAATHYAEEQIARLNAQLVQLTTEVGRVLTIFGEAEPIIDALQEAFSQGFNEGWGAGWTEGHDNGPVIPARIRARQVLRPRNGPIHLQYP